jgi:hypothetical protein
LQRKPDLKKHRKQLTLKPDFEKLTFGKQTMKTKSLLLTALLTVAGTAGLMAQSNVYSQNIVGYVSQVIPKGFSMVACQLKASPDNKVSTLMPTPPNGTFVYKFDRASGGYIVNDYIGGWEGDDDNMTLAPGEGVFVSAPSTFTNTFVGEVVLNSTNSLLGGYSVVSSVLPKGGALTSVQFPNVNGLFVYQYNPSNGGYIVNDYIGGWEGDGDGAAPTVAVGESFFVSLPAAQSANWVETFNVGP